MSLIAEGTVNFFLTAKAWQVFLILMGSMFLGSLVPSTPANFKLFMLGTLVFMLVWITWMWTIARAANDKLEPSLRKSQMPMTFGLGFAVLYLALAPWLWPDLSTGEKGAPVLVVPMHLGAMVGIFYALLFTANRLTTLERKQKVSFFDYAGPFFLFWFFPLGIWLIQPRVNKLFGSDG